MIITMNTLTRPAVTSKEAIIDLDTSNSVQSSDWTRVTAAASLYGPGISLQEL